MTAEYPSARHQMRNGSCKKGPAYICPRGGAGAGQVKASLSGAGTVAGARKTNKDDLRVAKERHDWFVRTCFQMATTTFGNAACHAYQYACYPSATHISQTQYQVDDCYNY